MTLLPLSLPSVRTSRWLSHGQIDQEAFPMPLIVLWEVKHPSRGSDVHLITIHLPTPALASCDAGLPIYQRRGVKGGTIFLPDTSQAYQTSHDLARKHMLQTIMGKVLQARQ
jgi:hypothetical protein